MEEPSPTNPLLPTPSEDRLDSWKEIAAYLSRDVTTAQRWEKRESMPVHRHLHDRAGSVYAFRTELDAWVERRKLPASGDPGTDIVPAIPPLPLATSSLGIANTRTSLYGLFFAIGAFAITAAVWLQKTDYFWRNPVVGVQFQNVTDLDGLEQAAAISRDGELVAFLSDHDGPMDVWVTHVGSGQYHNLTHGTASELINPSVRSLGFSPDGDLVTFWMRRPAGVGSGDGIGIWAVPTLGGQVRPYVNGVAELDWSKDGSMVTYHTPGPGDPLFVSPTFSQTQARQIHSAQAGLHSHFPSWAPDSAFIYFVHGSLPDKLDIWRIRSNGGPSERITSQGTTISHPVFGTSQTLLYLATEPDGSGPSLYSIDVEHRIPHRLTFGPERFTSLAATRDGHRLVLTLARPKTSLWRVPIVDSGKVALPPSKISLTTSSASLPRFGPDYLLYVAPSSSGTSIWKIANGAGVEVWNAKGAQVLGGPAISADGANIAVSARQNGKPVIYAMRADGTAARIVADSVDLVGAPAWTPDGNTIIAAANDLDIPHLYRFPLDGNPRSVFVNDYSVEPVWSPDGRFVVYSGADVGTSFSLKAVASRGGAYAVPPVAITRGSRHLSLTRDRIAFLRGGMKHKDVWLVDLKTGGERQLTNFPLDFDILDFDISPDGREMVVERVQEHSDVVLIDLPK